MLSPKSYSESKEIPVKSYNFVIIWFWDLWKWRHQLLTENDQNVYVCSLNGRRYNDPYSIKHNVIPYNVYNLPIPINEVDVVLICCTATDLDLLYECLPKQLIQEKVSSFVFFQNWIWIRQRIKEILNLAHPTQVIPYFSFKTMGWDRVDISFAKSCPVTGNLPTLDVLMRSINAWPHQDPIFEWMDSIVLRKEERKKWYVNSFLNTICVIYKLPAGSAVDEFIVEFGMDAKETLYKEFLVFNNEIAWDELAYMELEEIKEEIENAIIKFADKFPSTYNQYYTNLRDWIIYSDENQFIWKIIQISKLKNCSLPLLEVLYERMQKIKKDIEASYC